MFKATPDDRDAMLLNLRGALRTVPPALWRNLAKRRQPADDQAEKLVAERLLAHLERCGWAFGHQPSRR
ncbi:MAG: hypothetical protein WAS21_23195 [Geminicoccaceae bacterium]